MRLTILLKDTISSVQKAISNDLNIVKVDRYIINIRAGTGGSGIPRYNGIGGNGGSVFFIAKPNVAFTDIRKRLANRLKIQAASGSPSKQTSLIGKNAQSTYIEVPVGVEAVNHATNTLIARCTRPFQRYLIAKGGVGGGPENGYKGERGDFFDVAVHLKLRPNIGLVGFPNAGKSTLLQAFIPNKSVKIAPYPFTTVNPQIGFFHSKKPETAVATPFEDTFSLSIADLPGIIEGASQNRGRGYQFLKHVEYADVLLFVVDCNGFQLKNELDCPFRSALESVALLNKELENYEKRLLKKPIILVLNKTDLLKDEKTASELVGTLSSRGWSNHVAEDLRPAHEISFNDVIALSAQSGQIDRLKSSLTRLHTYLHPLKDPEDEERTHKRFV